MVKAEYNITRMTAIAKAGGSTKICPYCCNPVLQGMLHVAISDGHKSESTSMSRSKVYSNHRLYIHTDCFPLLAKEVQDKIKELKTDIKENHLKIGAEHI